MNETWFRAFSAQSQTHIPTQTASGRTSWLDQIAPVGCAPQSEPWPE